MMNKVFLATTALEDFWDKDAQQFLFLGEWCKLFDKKESYTNLNFKTLNYIWTDEQEIDRGIDYCENIYQSVLKKLVNILNNHHGVSEDLRYWNILLKPWLLIYIQIIYDKYKHLKLANSKFTNLYTYTIKSSEFQYINIPTTFLNNIANNDEYNLQIYSQIIKFLNIKHLDIDYSMKNIDIKTDRKETRKEKVLRYVSKLLNKIFNKKSILVVNLYFKNNSLEKIIELSFKSKFLFVFDNMRYDVNIDNNYDEQLRKNIFSNLNSHDEFINLIFDTLKYNFPLIYLENYNLFNKKVLNLPIKKPRIIYSVNAIHGNEVFKFFVSHHYKNMTLLYGQHGGNIGIDKINIPESIERNYADIYYTFGWQEKDTNILVQQKIIHNRSDKSKGINLIMTSMPRYFYRYTYQEESSKMLYYINNTKQFLLNFKNIDILNIRLYMQDYGWNIKKRLLEDNQNLKFENKTSYYKQIKSVKLNIFDHLHTGYLETLSMNIPTIIIIPKNIYYFRDSANHYIQMLKDVQILWEDPIKASEFVDDIYESIDVWWQSEKVQKVREIFCYRYARTSENWTDEWAKEFNRVLDESKRR